MVDKGRRVGPGFQTMVGSPKLAGLEAGAIIESWLVALHVAESALELGNNDHSDTSVCSGTEEKKVWISVEAGAKMPRSAGLGIDGVGAGYYHR